MNTVTSFQQGTLSAILKRYSKLLIAVAGIAFACLGNAVNLTPLPPYLSETKGAPMVMLNMSKDHQLFYKAYNEYSDLDGDGVPETQYKHSYRYYGYFDNRRCYNYSTTNNRFTPTRSENGSSVANPTYCGGTGEWHGNFLNWASMTRMDVVRRILYGGMRSTDDSIVSGTSLTVLERAHLPTDAHSFAKYYQSNAADIRLLTPFSGQTEITMCNTSFKNGQYSHGNISAPSLLVAGGNFALWNSNERWQCYWSEDKNASNGNVAATSGLAASSGNPSRATNGLGTGYAVGSYTVRVEVCKTGLDGVAAGASGFTSDEEGRCKYYPLGNYKPAGLLQKYGERNEAAFGLMTGSLAKNISGGVLRKNVATFTDEVDLDDGQFKDVPGIVRSLNRLRIYGYDYDDGTYISADGCSYQQISLSDGTCTSWGNPMGEMYLEALRYFAGKSESSDYKFTYTGSKDQTLGLEVAVWSDPFANSTVGEFGDVLCRRTNIINFNASVTSYDNDQWSKQTDIKGITGSLSVESLTDSIGASEGLYAAGKKWSIGKTASDGNELCNDKTIAALSTSVGICPESPTGAGGFKMAGAAMYAHANPIRDPVSGSIPSNNKRAFRVDTYGVALSTGVPRIKVAIPGQFGKFVIIVPAYRLDLGANGKGSGTLVDFRVVSQTATAGKYVVQWEDSEQGGDYDQDVWGTLEYRVLTNGSIEISTQTVAQATANGQGFGYGISGTNGFDGVYFHSGILGFNYTNPFTVPVTPTTNLNASGGCNSCQVNNVKTTATFPMLGVSGEALKDPLWYAAKYGGYDRDAQPSYTPGDVLPATAWDSKKTDGSLGSDGIPDNYFYAIDPAQLERSLEQIFSTILKAGGAAPAAATSSRTAAGGYVYVSTHSIRASSPGNDSDASGEFLRYGFTANGNITGAADWDAGAKLTTQIENGGWDTGRRIFTMTNTGPNTFRWASLPNVSPTTERNALKRNPATGASDSDSVAQARLEWLRGSSTNETTAGGLRKRTKTKLGAIINSTPWYVGPPSAGYTNVEFGGGYGSFRTDATNAARNTVFVAANDGMLHAFNGDTGNEQFAYVPRAMYTTSSSAPYSKLAAIPAKDFVLNSGTERINVDGSVMAADLKIGSSWRTYLFGSFGRGARGVYALDVTTPQTITAETTAAATNLVKWEFTEAADSDMGYIVGRTNARGNGQPVQTGRMANGKWAAIYGNGYNSASGRAALFILFADGPTSASSTTWTSGTASAQYVKLLTGTAGDGPDNGLAAPTAVDTNNDGLIDAIYAGDLKGNVWKFNVSGTDPTTWGVATTGSVPTYQATTVLPAPSSTVVAQPITTAVVPFAHPQGGYLLFFGTGKALESTDYPMTTLFSQTLYGIYDKPGTSGTVTTGKTGLIQQTATTSGAFRYLSYNAVSYPTDKGWYLNLPASSEGVIFNPIAEDSLRVNVRSLAPEATTDGCRYDATSYDAAINPIFGKPISNALPDAPDVAGSGALGKASGNTFEFSRGGVYKVTTPPPSTIACVAGSLNCVCNPATPAQCVLCPDPATCNPPWKPLPSGQCLYRTISALGSGGVATSERYGACTDGRLTWREVLRNR